MRRLWVGLIGAGCGGEVVDTAQAPPPLSLAASEAGGVLTLTASGAIPGTRVYFAGSLAGPGAGPCPPVLGGQCLGVASPVLIGQRPVGVSGVVTLSVPLPAGVTAAWAQAAMAAGAGSLVSNVAPFLRARTVADLGPGDLVLTEALLDPSAVADTVGEWFEVYNPGATPIDLAGLVVRDHGTDQFLVGALTVEAGGYVVIGASTDVAVNGGAAVDHAWSSFVLGNGADELVLEAGGVVVDEIVWDGGPVWPSTGGRAMSLTPTATSAVANDAGGAWCAASTVYGAGDRGTPGAANPACAGPPPLGVDVDGDGSDASVDCDDRDRRTRPGAAEVCDGLDNDCSGAPGPSEADGDGDGMPDCDACAGVGWRTAVDTLTTPTQARSVLGGLVAGQSCSSYSAARGLLFTLTDYDAGEAECVYTGVRVAVPSGPPDHTIMNVEHSWPRSLGSGAPPAECDLHHLFPSDSDANTERANLPFGEVVSGVTWSVGGSLHGATAAGVDAFEPRDAHKGNVARAMLYMHLRHGLALTAAEVDLYQAWSVADPVDQAELRRTLMVGALQGVANPLVVCPEAVDAL
jgi:hypothetical protein